MVKYDKVMVSIILDGSLANPGANNETICGINNSIIPVKIANISINKEKTWLANFKASDLFSVASFEENIGTNAKQIVR